MTRAGILLDVSRINSGRLRLELEPCDIAALLRDMAAISPTRPEGQVSLSASPPLTRLLGTWDRLALEQIIDNLVSNALKYGAGTPVEVSAESCGERVRLQVRDHGSGIPAADRERVFGRFERAVGQGERRSGFGVGLWVVRQLTEAMEGSVVVGDTPGGGASFTVTLPHHPEEAALMNEPTGALDRVPSGIAGLDTILGGGFLKGGLYIVQGTPGTGKTTLANQICFNHAARGGQALYITLLAEYHARMMQHLGSMSFFDIVEDPRPDQLHQRLRHPAPGGLRRVCLTCCAGRSSTRKATVLILDGFATAQRAVS